MMAAQVICGTSGRASTRVREEMPVLLPGWCMCATLGSVDIHKSHAALALCKVNLMLSRRSCHFVLNVELLKVDVRSVQMLTTRLAASSEAGCARVEQVQ